MSEVKTTEVLLKKKTGELYLLDAARRMGVADSTVRDWKRMGWIPVQRRIGGYVMKASTCDKVKNAMLVHRRKWMKEIVLGPDDSDFEHGLKTFRQLVDPASECSPRPEAEIAQTVSVSAAKMERLVKMAKELFAIGESDLGHRVSARAVQLMP
ncbi:hypothetical protein [Bdellovibrio bacteriovorus]|uniref:hypothetical protein n=1 Tax=Bdellovibrio bacteriovorus TaxID=959 RepID=UPI0035A5B902